ncbi:MAG TPA: VanZ family protein [Roseiflexaceae bacterium]|nr:VanZ family protein [Roseiflexaceae bacterium]
MYVTFALNEVFFPLSTSGRFADASRSFSPAPQVNLTPLYFGPYADMRRVFVSSVQNILLTIPFGFGMNFLKRLTLKRNVIIAFVLGLVLEFVQYVISLLLGYAYRVVDVNDVLLNALGVVIGYGIFRLFAWFYVTITEKLCIEHKGLSAYVYHIAERA